MFNQKLNFTTRQVKDMLQLNNMNLSNKVINIWKINLKDYIKD